jgi:hypothetical protein
MMQSAALKAAALRKSLLRSLPSAFFNVVIMSEAPFPTRRPQVRALGCERGICFWPPAPGVSAASQPGQQLRANVRMTSARIEDTKFPVMNTCAKRVGG